VLPLVPPTFSRVLRAACCGGSSSNEQSWQIDNPWDRIRLRQVSQLWRPSEVRESIVIASASRRDVREVRSRRRGAASLDYILTLGTMLSMAAVAIAYSRRLIVLAYEVICGLISWPFM
jgi:hypothetical protein